MEVPFCTHKEITSDKECETKSSTHCFKIYKFVTMVYGYHNSGHYPLSCLIKQLYGDSILSPCSSGTYSVGPNRQS
jgi:hypothetical protein